MNDIEVTIFTPTHNRGYIIGKCYESICAQSCKKFEWIIVNDGSTDNTDELVKQWSREKKISNLIYIKNDENCGMAHAMNMAIIRAKGRICFKVDDDDILRQDAIEQILKYDETIVNKADFAGVSGLCYRFDGDVIGKEWRNGVDYLDATNLERKKYGLDGDKAEAYYTEVLKKYGLFPEFIGESFVFEGILWNRIAHAGLKIRWFNEKIYMCEYLPDGLTQNHFKTCKKNFCAYSCMVNEYKGYCEAPFFERFKVSSKYFAVGFAKGLRRKQLPNIFVWDKGWLFIAYFYGWIIYRLRILLKPQKYKEQ